jgi:farnesyl diphosphate synthase
MAAQAFRDYFPRLLELLETALLPDVTPEVLKHTLDLVKYSTHGGKLWRGIVACSTYLELTNTSADSPDAEPGFLLGWSQELIQAAYLVSDDLMDQSLTRRGQQCWYRYETVGLSAVNDGLLLEAIAFIALEALRRFLPDPVVDSVIDTVRWSNLKTMIGQSFDTLPNKPHDFVGYDIIVQNKTAHYTIWLPIVSGIVASQKVSREEFEDSTFTGILMDMGKYFQVEDDWLDIYGDPAVTGKVGTDLEDGKVTWMSCTAVQLCNDEQRERLLRSLGSDPAAARAIYDAVDVSGAYEKFERETRESLVARIALLSHVYPKATITTLLASLTKRRA